jgi:hypothetical protein
LSGLRKRAHTAVGRLRQMSGKALALIALPVVAFAVTDFAIGGGHAGNDFYGTAAQVIPVLLLAFVIEGRAYRLVPTMDASTRLLVILTFILLAAGEGVALYDLAGGKEGSGDVGVVAASIAGGFAGIAVIGLLGQPSEDDWRRIRSDYRREGEDDDVPRRKPQ